MVIYCENMINQPQTKKIVPIPIAVTKNLGWPWLSELEINASYTKGTKRLFNRAFIFGKWKITN